jgi:hypothetical protein
MMGYYFDDNVIAATIGEYVLFGLPVRASVSTFSGEYDLFSPHGSIAENDEGIELWFEGDPDGPESGIFIRGTVERGVVSDLIAREIDGLDAWQDDEGAHILIAAGEYEVVLKGDPDTIGWLASLEV